MNRNSTTSKENPLILIVDDLRIDTHTQTVSREGVTLPMPELSYRLLETLARHAPNHVTKDQLVEEVWQGIVVSDETLAQRVRLLRQVLGENRQNPRYIASIRNKGYRLLASVSDANESKTSNTQSFPSLRMVFVVLGLATLTILITTLNFVDNDPEPAHVTRHTLAILPFADLSANEDKGYFADGIQEELLNRLSQLEQLNVVSRTSVMPYRSSELSIPELGIKLGASVILEGSVRLSENRVRITAQLIDASTDHHMWSQNFDRELSVQSIFAIQSEVANSIAKALQLELSSGEETAQVSLPTENLEAYNLYLLGRYHTFRQTVDDLLTAVDLLERATSLDGRFAEAWAVLGWAYSFQGTFYGLTSPHQAYAKAREAATRALALKPKLADAHSLYADILTWYDWDWVAAEREYQAAMTLDQYNGLGYALFLSIQMRHEEAIELVEKLTAQFPEDTFVHSNAAWRFLNARQYDRAVQEGYLSGDHIDARKVIGWALLLQGELEKAVTIFEQDLQESPQNAGAISNLAVASIRNGQLKKGQILLDKLLTLNQTQAVSPDIVAAVYFEQGNADAGFEWLQKALESKSRGLIFLQVDHVYDDYRQDPRYHELLEDLGF